MLVRPGGQPMRTPTLSMMRPKVQEADGVGALEPEHDLGVIGLRPAQIRLQRGLEDATIIWRSM